MSKPVASKPGFDVAKRIYGTVTSCWKKYGHFGEMNIDKNARKEHETIFVFPGQSLLRPPIRTD